MKRLRIVLFILISFLFITNVKANTINSIDMDVFIDDNGNAKITEIWDANLTEGTEGYRPFSGMENKVISNFSVTDESGKSYEVLNTWNVNRSFSEKAYKCGYNKTYDGVELCFGISKYGHKTYTLKYDISNFVTEYTDTQGIYFKFINFDQNIGNVKIKIHSNTPLTLDNAKIWGFGYEGTDVFEDGNIIMDSNGTLDSYNYMTLLVRFESNIFKTDNKSDRLFDDVYDEAFEDVKEEEYHDDDVDFWNGFKEKTLSEKIFTVIFGILTFIITLIFSPFGFMAIIIFILTKSGNLTYNQTYKYENGKHLPNEKDIMYYREIPCNKDLEKAYFVCKNYDVVTLKNLKKGLMGAIILKWIKNKYITVVPTKKGLFSIKDNNYALDFTNMTHADNEIETELYNMMTSAAGFNKLLEPKELEKWSKNHYTKIDSWYNSIITKKEKELMSNGLIIEKEWDVKGMFGKTKSRKFKTLTSNLKTDAEHLVGFKKFLLDFSIMPEREYKEVAVWENYLIFANLLGIADKVSEQFSKIYPNFNQEASFDVDMGRMVAMSLANDTFRGYDRGVAAARARDYSGGSSWGGGGGSSFSSGGSSSGGSSGGGFR